ncbi:MAG TPA: hypothetical protein DCS67_06150, partial [Clostridiales bacterium UBA8960]|nr:hypothetical protein [Clostridiales bacterium UBA8960]
MDKTTQDFFDKMKALTGKTYEEIEALYSNSGLTKHSEIRNFFMDKLQLSYGYANTLVHLITKSDGTSMAEGKDMETLLEEIYDAKKIHLRPIHDTIMEKIHAFGDFEIVPKKGYLSLKRKRQFAMIGPKSSTRIEISINIKDIEGTDRLLEQPKGSMCKFIVKIQAEDEVDSELIGWL